MWLRYSLLLLLALVSSVQAQNFNPDTDDFDLYGAKVAANEVLIVEVQNTYNEFWIQFAPYYNNATQFEQSCVVEFDASQYVYTVTVGRNQTAAQFFFIGETTDIDQNDPVENRTFVGTFTYHGSIPDIDCRASEYEYNIQYIPTAYPHQDYLTLTADVTGSTAFCFSNLFSCTFNTSPNSLNVWPGNISWPNTTFMPHAVDYHQSYGVIVGFVDNGRNSRVKFKPIVYLFAVNISAAPSVSAVWQYSVNGTWQSGQTNVGADVFAAKYSMSVKLNDARQVLVGIQSMNTVFLFSVSSSLTTLTQIASQDTGKSWGFGKEVAWLDYSGSSVAILANVYSFSYTWSSSRIFVYDSFTNASSPVAIFPNSQQALSENMSPTLLNVVSTPVNLAFVDVYGNIFVILSSPAGTYPSTTGSDEQSNPAFSTATPCIVGTYKNVSNIHPCSLCPTATKNPGNSSTSCSSCAANTFCPLGSSSDIDLSSLNAVIQALAYPESPELTGFDDILLVNVFGIGTTAHCVVVSPLFWAIIVAILALIVMITIALLKYRIKHAESE
ncbi:unnamed protein product, partial [Didymodactylos carnosus]